MHRITNITTKTCRYLRINAKVKEWCRWRYVALAASGSDGGQSEARGRGEGGGNLTGSVYPHQMSVGGRRGEGKRETDPRTKLVLNWVAIFGDIFSLIFYPRKKNIRELDSYHFAISDGPSLVLHAHSPNSATKRHRLTEEEAYVGALAAMCGSYSARRVCACVCSGSCRPQRSFTRVSVSNYPLAFTS